ncbi:hypothetical protein DYU05_06075 [Mucilaginibacter terrenus]|uniref:Lanthionine synthetase n=1 Tax=Mucilaginibacter terrenus TaxID=2482727 RepID=A0A3E2NVX5_9SPHI|nr:lanthionine synthetase LanC family protein [Mucilaginibacter terrenus]RFZ85165.1 hypothetical protein DYU05_06075 [Mucilaginibacter terrenus]
MTLITERIIPILHRIHENTAVLSTGHAGLMSGDAGLRLFTYQYNKYFNQSLAVPVDATVLEDLVAVAYRLESATFCDGKAGVNWFFNYLNREDVISQDDLDFICDDNDEVAARAVEMTEYNNYDYLHGGTGVFYGLLYGEPNKNKPYFDRFFSLLTNLVNESPGKDILPYFAMEEYGLKLGEVNLSLSHGISSVLKFCMECIRRKVCTKDAGHLAAKIAEYLYQNHSDGSAGSYFTSIISGKPDFSPSRMAWCYGDLSIGYILLQYGLLTGEHKFRKLALEVLHHTIQRRNYRNEIVSDAGICHGTSGIAHIYNRLSTTYQLSEFESARDYWMDQTLIKIEGANWRDGYKKYNGYLKVHEEDHALLEGSAGIGLVLLSHISSDFNWDYLLMLH